MPFEQKFTTRGKTIYNLQKTIRPVRLARPEDPKSLQQHALNQRSPAEGKGKGRIG